MPKVTIICRKNSEQVYLYPSIRKTLFFLRNKADSYLKNGFLITVRVRYVDGNYNIGSYNKIEDLFWAYQAFIEEYV